VPGDDPSGLPGAEHDAPAAERREDRRDLEVVVANVVPGDLVVPEELPRPSREHEKRVGVERRAGIEAAVRVAPGAAPRGGIRVADVDVAALVDADRVPGAAPARFGPGPGLRDRVEAPDDLPGAGGERVHGAVAAPGKSLGAEVDAAAVD